MLELIIWGIGLGIILSFLTGPVFFALIKTSIEKGFFAGVALASGVVVCDAIYVLITIFGTSLIKFESTYRLPIGIIGSSVLLLIGIYYLVKKVEIKYQDNQVPSIKHARYFFKGFFMCIFNPFLLLYWISVLSTVYATKGELNKKELFVFFGTILITLFCMDILKAYFSYKMRYKIKEHVILKINKVAGVLIILFALKIIYNLIFTSSLF